jgi:outer membrane protein OmpA-like peptidoglycan-associated protein
MRKLHIILITLFLFCQFLASQTNVSISRKDFKKEKPGFSEAWKHIKDGDSNYAKKGIWYSNAATDYSLASTYNNDNAELNYKLGVSCLFSDKKDEAAGFFLKAIKLAPDVADDVLLLTGRALQYSSRFKEAIEMFNNYLANHPKKPVTLVALAKKCIENCNSAKNVTNDTLRIDIKNIGGNINSDADDYSIVMSPDGKKMFFASRRSTGIKVKTHFKDSKFDENIYSSDYLNGAWTVALLADKNLVTPYCETPLFLSSSGEELYIYTGYEGGGDVKVSVIKKDKWTTPEKVNFGINSSSAETSFSIAPSGDEIAFVSDRRKGGSGGKDIYLIKKLNKRKWSKPENIGPVINTPYNEESVRYSKKGDVLWFSSTGHNSIGGYDIFYSKKGPTGEWSTPVNAGYPINTPWDEIFYNPSPSDDSSFFFVSNRSKGFGGLDIYSGKILPPLPPPLPPIVVVKPPIVSDSVIMPKVITPPKPDTIFVRDTVIVIKEIVPVAKDTVKVNPVVPEIKPEPPKEFILYLIGKVTDSETGGAILARIDVIDLSTNQVITTSASSDVDGSYRIRLPAKRSYMLDLRSTGFLPDMKKVNIPETYTEEVYPLNLTLVKVKVGEKVVLNNILFELGKSVLTTSSYAELDKLVQIMKDNPKMKIEISGHTDNTGNPVINAKLSTDRAKAVVDYLVKKGVEQNRMTYMGYGSDQPIAENTTDAGRKKNRRVEFKILEF